MNFTQKISVLILFFIQFQTKAQLSGTYYVPSGIPSIAAAINSLNLQGVSGPVTIAIAAGYTETAVSGGYQLYPVSGASAINSISFLKSGTGNNPKISASSGSLPPYSLPADGVWWLIGADYINIENIDFEDPNTAGNSMMEVGIGMLRNGPNDGCQYNTIRNCRFSLQKTNAWPFYLGATAIALLNSAFTGTVSPPSQPSGSNSFNRIYSNYIENVNTGVAAIGFYFSNPSANADQGNDIGGVSAVTGNTVVNFGGGGNSNNIAYGIKASAQYSYNASYNIVTNNNGSGADPIGGLDAVRLESSPNTVAVINSNTLNLRRNGSTYAQLNGVYIENSSASNSGSITIENNTIPAYGFTCSTPGGGSLIYCNAQTAAVSRIRFNSISNVSISVSTGTVNSAFYMIGQCQFSTSIALSSNSISNVYGDGTTMFYSLLTLGAPNYSVNDNYVDGIHWQNSSVFFSGINDQAPSGSVGYISNNKIKNISAANGSNTYGLYCASNTASSTVINNNEIGSYSTTAGFDNGYNFTGLYFNNVSASLTISGNTIHSVAITGTNSAASASVRGIFVYSGNGSGRIFKNKIYDLAHEYSGVTEGIYLLGVNSYSVYNNLLGKLSAPKTNSATAVTAIYLGIGAGKFHHNSVYLDASSTSTLFGSTCFAVSVGNGTSWELRNNIFINLSTPTGSGVASVLRQSSVYMTSFSSASDRNLYYAGSTSSTHVIYDAQWSTYASLSAFKLLVTPREAHSKTELPPFLTTTGGNSNFLNIDPTIPTQVEGNAAPIAYITDDYAGNSRNISTPDIGAWEGAFMIADTVSPGLNSSGFTSDLCNLSQRTLTANISDPTGIASGAFSPRVYYKLNNGLYSSTQGSLSAGTASNGVWFFVLTYNASVNDVVSYFLAFQDASTLNNFTMSPSTGGNGTDVNTIGTYPSQPLNYTINAQPVITVSTGSICAGETFTFMPSGALTYSISGGLFAVSPLVTTIYTITGNDANQCPANPITANLVVYSLPTISVSNATICQGSNYNLSPSGAHTYSYSNGSPIVTPLVNTSYTISGMSVQACPSSNTVVAYITVLPSPTLNVLPIDTICPGSTQTLIVLGALSYTWQTGVLNDTILVSPMVSSIYSVTGSGLNACTTNITVTVPVYVLPTLTVQGNTTICLGETTALSVLGSALSFTWSTGDAGASVTISPLTTDTFSVGGIEANGCLNSTSLLVQVNNCTRIIDHEISEATVLVFPNPSSGYFFVDFTDVEPDRVIKIKNILGQTIYEEAAQEKHLKIKLTGIARGTYILTVYQKNQQHSSRIVVD